MKQNSKVIHEKYEFRNIHKDEIEQAAEIESICGKDLQWVPAPDALGAADLLGDHHPAQLVDAAHNSDRKSVV